MAIWYAVNFTRTSGGIFSLPATGSLERATVHMERTRGRSSVLYRLPRRHHPSPSCGALLVCAAALASALGVACGESSSAGSGAQDAADTHGLGVDTGTDTEAVATCPAAGRTPSGSCCEEGRFFSEETAACEAVGPPECAAVALEDPAACMPRWCWELPAGGARDGGLAGFLPQGRRCADGEAGAGCPAGMWQAEGTGCSPAGMPVPAGQEGGWDQGPPPIPPLGESIPRWCWDLRKADGGPCVPGDTGCHPVGRQCSPAEFQAGEGCPPGAGPSTSGTPGCQQAGLADQATVPPGPPEELPALGPLPSLVASIPGDVPPLVDMVPLTEARFCLDQVTGEARFCALDEPQCATEAGEPDPTACLSAGVPWSCPPGFVEATGSVSGELPACVPDPDDCGTAPFGGPTPSGTIFVQSGAPPGGDGSHDAPFASITEALSAVPPGGTVALAAGTYAAPVALAQAVTLQGRCAALVTIDGTGGLGAVWTKGPMGTGQAKVSRVRLTGNSYGARVTAAGSLRLERVWIDSAQGLGLYAASPGTTLEVVDTVIAGTREDGSDVGAGLSAKGGAAVELTRVRLSENGTVGAGVEGGGTTVAAVGLLVDGTLPRQSDQRYGTGIQVRSGAALSLSGARLSRNRHAGLYAGGSGTKVVASGLLVDATRSEESSKAAGVGVVVDTGAQLVLSGSRLTANRVVGLNATGSGTKVTAHGLLIDFTLPQEADSKWGLGASITHGAELSISSGRLSFNSGGGLLVAYADTHVAATDLLVDGSWSAMPELEGGLGISVELGARLQILRARLSKTWGVALACSGSGTRVDASELLIDGTLPGQGSSGPGLKAGGGAALVLANARLSGNGGAGLEAADVGTRVEASGLLVDDSLGGVTVTTGADFLLTAARLSGNRGAGLFVGGNGTRVEASGLMVDGTQHLEGDAGFGIWVIGEVDLVVSGARLTGNRMTGFSMFGPSNPDPGRGAGSGALRVEAAGLLVDGTLPVAQTEELGMGVFAYDAEVLLVGSRLSGNRAQALTAGGKATSMVATGLLIDGTLPQQSDGMFGDGIGVGDGARLWLAGGRLSGNRGSGILASDVGSTVDAVGLLVDGTLPQSGDLRFGRGIGVQGGAWLSLAGARLSGNREVGLFGVDAGTTLDVVGVIIEGTLAQESDGEGGTGAWLNDGAHAELKSCLITGNRSAGVAFDRSSGVVEGSAVVRTALAPIPTTDGPRFVGDGILAIGAPSLIIDSTLVADNARAGVLAAASSNTAARYTAFTGSNYGLVVQDAVLTEHAVLAYENELNRVSDQGLAVPEPPQAAKPFLPEVSGTP